MPLNGNYIRLFVAMIALIILVSCDQEFRLDDLQYEEKLVVNSIFTPDSTWAVYVSSSWNILDPEAEGRPVTDAEVVLKTALGATEGQLTHVGQGKYILDNQKRPFNERTYRIEVSADGFEPVWAVGRAPKAASIEAEASVAVIDDNSDALRVEFSIADDGNEKNYYIWELIHSVDEVDDKLDLTLDQLGSFEPAVWLRDLNTDIISTEYQFQTRLFLSDREFQGAIYNASFIALENTSTGQVDDDSSNSSTGEGEPSRKLKIRLLTVSEDLYNYYRSIEAYRINGGFQSSNVDPTGIFSNVYSGFGIYGGYGQTLIEI